MEPPFWRLGMLKLFVTHLAAHRQFAADLQEALWGYGISAFVAHNDIEPTQEWQTEIETALATCDALVALLHPEFHQSNWTDQETGFAMGRGIPVFSIRFGQDPYGFIGRFQAFDGKGKSAQTLARELFDTYRKNKQTQDAMAEALVSLFEHTIDHLKRILEIEPECIVHDMHPDYLSTKHARQLGVPACHVQHHWAHVLACMAENEITPPALGISWDGTGYGTDGTIWGGEFLLARGDSFERVAHFRQFRLPGGEAAVKQPSRTALGVLFEIWGDATWKRFDLPPVRDFSENQLRIIRRMLNQGLNAPVTSSVGRLFDAVASLTGLRQRVSFEGQAAMDLEFAIQGTETTSSYPFEIRDGVPLTVDWRPTIERNLERLRGSVSGQPRSGASYVSMRIGLTSVFAVTSAMSGPGAAPFRNRLATTGKTR
jgi:nucleoside 2-deoxyribosyltransferase